MLPSPAMSRRGLIAALLAVTLLAALPLTCPCPSASAAPAGRHDCCTPPTGVRAARPCCGAALPDLVPVAPTLVAEAPLAAWLSPCPATQVRRERARAAVAAFSPPPLVLRI